ncbi:uncharacterized protein LOC114284365 [Camellia sinensis]|uniref:uncharacterized protein LOC114284365 n=1 Tax=Camellia sinensis TaxID=4442 RepID=UPI0010362138|nr:uncharacterized protein LOC114284365 [Camellia sinensis]
MENARSTDAFETSDARMDRLERMKFNKMKPPTFQGELEPLKAEAWILEIEKLFEVFPCSEEQKVLLATFTLQEKARMWWMLIRDQNTTMTSAQFKELKLGTMSVAKYEAKFTEFARYVPHMVDTDYKKARKFEGGLDVEVLDWINVLKLVKYVDVLDRALMTEANIATLKQVKTLVTEWKGKIQRLNFKKGRNNSNIS